MSEKSEKQELASAQEAKPEKQKKAKKKVIKLPKVNADLLPKWLHQSKDDTGDVIGYSLDQANCALAVIESMQLTAFTGGEVKDVYSWDDTDGVWRWMSLDDLKTAVGDEIQAGFERCGLELLITKVTDSFVTSAAKLTKVWAPTERTEDTFARIETDQELNVIPCQSFDWVVNAPEGQHVAPFNPDYYFTNRLPYDIEPEEGYQPGVTGAATSSKAFETNQWLLESVGNDLGQLSVLKILIGNSLCRTNKKLQAIVFMTGEGEDGKSTFLSYLQDDLLGSDNTSDLSLEQLLGQQGGSNYNPAQLYHKLANVCADINGTKLTAARLGVIKTLTGGDKVDAQRKFQSNLRFAPYAKMWFSCNVLPRMSGLTYAEKRRFMVFKWHKIQAFEKNFSLDRIRQERGAFVFECIQEFQAYVARRAEGEDQLTALRLPESMKQNFEDFRALGDPVVAFIKAACVEDAGEIVTKGDLFEAFKDWCIEFGHKPAANSSQTAFSRKLAQLGFETKKVRREGKMPRAFVGLRLLPEDDWRDYDDVMEARENRENSPVVDLENDRREAIPDLAATLKPSPVLDPSPTRRLQYVKRATDDELNEMVKDPDEKVRQAVARRGRPENLAILVHDPNEFVRRVAQQVLDQQSGLS